MGKLGYRVKARRRLKSGVGKAQRVTPEESMGYIKENFGVEIVD